MYRFLIILLLMATWVVFSGQLDGAHLFMGLVSSSAVLWISGDLLSEDRKVSLSGRGRQFVGMAGYCLFLLREIVSANLHVLRLAMLPGGMKAVKPQVFRFKTNLKTDFAKWILANSITLTPGTVTISVRDDWFYIHAISAKVLMESGGEMERRIQRIYEPEERS